MLQEKAKLCQDIGQSNKCLGSSNSELICFFANFNLTCTPFAGRLLHKASQNNGKLYVVFGFPELQTKCKVKTEMNFLTC